MKNSNYYKDKIIEIITSYGDIVFLRRIYKLIYIITKIDDDWILNQIDKLINKISN